MTDREVVITHLDNLRLFADETVHHVVSPDNWDVYSSLCDYIDQIKTEVETLLKEQNDNIGHWVVLENCSNAGVYCSECHTKIFDRYPMKKKYSYFCPHCGTRMEGQAVKWE